MKSIMMASKTTTIPNVEVDMSKLQLKKGLNINEEGSGSSIVKFVATSEPKGKGKCVMWSLKDIVTNNAQQVLYTKCHMYLGLKNIRYCYLRTTRD